MEIIKLIGQTILVTVAMIVLLFIIYSVVRVVMAAVFRAYYETKNQFEREKNNGIRQKKDEAGSKRPS